jgi:hypothetical protein
MQMQNSTNCFQRGNSCSDSSSSESSGNLEEWIAISKNLIIDSESELETLEVINQSGSSCESSAELTSPNGFQGNKICGTNKSNNQLVSQKRFICDFCEMTFIKKQFMQNHMNLHRNHYERKLNLRRWLCTIGNCLHDFETKTELITHQMIHTSE